MKKSKPSEEQQITYALREVESGRSPADVCRQLSVSEAKSCIWKKKYAVQSRGVVPPLHARRPRPAPGADSTLAHARPRFGFTRIWVLLCREGWPVNKKRVRRLYRPDGLQLRMRVRRRKHIALHRGPAPTPAGPTERWSMDFVHDALADGYCL